MFKQELSGIRKILLLDGVSPKYVRRTLRELEDHYEDIKSGLIQNGMSGTEAELAAAKQIGDLNAIARQVMDKSELKSFISLHPKLTLLAAPILCYLLTSILCILILILAVQNSGINNMSAGDPVPAMLLLSFRLISTFYAYIFPVLLALAFVVIASKRYFPNTLVLLSLFIISLLGTLFFITIEGGIVGESRLSLSLSFLGYMPPLAFSGDVFLESIVRLAINFSIAYTVWHKLSVNQEQFATE